MHGNGEYEVAAPAPPPWMFSTILALQVADGLARFGSISPDVIYHKDANNVATSFARELTNINVGNYSWYPRDEYFDVVARRDTSEWTEVTWQVKRFRYGWGFEGITIKLAAPVLLFHVLLVLIHVPTVIMTGWTSTCWSNVGEVLALAMNSQRRIACVPLQLGSSNLPPGKRWLGSARLVTVDFNFVLAMLEKD